MAERGTHKPYVAGSNPAVGTIPLSSKTNFMPVHQQSANRLTERVHAAVRAVIERADASRILVACSGGADSMCLLHAVAFVARHGGQQVVVCHVRHRVRADDARDAETVRAAAERLNLACRVVSLTDLHAAHREPFTEAKMRNARYRALAEVADEMHATVVLTGHTLDDQSETVLLHLLRGAGVDGLGGMAEETCLPLQRDAHADAVADRHHIHIRVVRPLLSIRRAETVAYCAAYGLSVANDPTNDDQLYTRNWLRHAILPALRTHNPDIAAVLARAASSMRDDAAFLAAETARAMARCDYRYDRSFANLNLYAFASEHVAIQRRILRAILPRITSSVPRFDDVDAIRRHASSNSSAIWQYGGVACANAFGRLAIGSADAVTQWVRVAASCRYPLAQGEKIIPGDGPLQLALPEAVGTAYYFQVIPFDQSGHEMKGDNAVAIPLRLPGDHSAIIRNRKPADRFWPSGSARPLLLRTFLSARGVPAPVRDLLPLLVVNDTIAWVLGHEVGVPFAATRATATHIGILTCLDAQERIMGGNAKRETTNSGDGRDADQDTAHRRDDSGESD